MGHDMMGIDLEPAARLERVVTQVAWIECQLAQSAVLRDFGRFGRHCSEALAANNRRWLGYRRVDPVSQRLQLHRCLLPPIPMSRPT